MARILFLFGYRIFFATEVKENTEKSEKLKIKELDPKVVIYLGTMKKRVRHCEER